MRSDHVIFEKELQILQVKALSEIKHRIEIIEALRPLPPDSLNLEKLTYQLYYLALGAGSAQFTDLSQLALHYLNMLRQSPDSSLDTAAIQKLHDLAVLQGAPRAHTKPPSIRSALSVIADGFVQEYSQIKNLAVFRFPGSDFPDTMLFELEKGGFSVNFFDDISKLEKALETFPAAALLLYCNSKAEKVMDEIKLPGGGIWDTLPILFMCDGSSLNHRLLGTRFGANYFIPLPARADKIMDTIYRATHPSGPAIPRVLILSEDTVSNQILGLHFKRQGWLVDTLQEPHMILDRMASFNPDFLITGLYLKPFTGLELAAVIHQHEIYHETRILFLASPAILAPENGHYIPFTSAFCSVLTPSVILDQTRMLLENNFFHHKKRRLHIWNPN